MRAIEMNELAADFLGSICPAFKLRCVKEPEAAITFVVEHDEAIERDDVRHFIDVLGFSDIGLDEELRGRIARMLLVFEFLQTDSKRLAAMVERARNDLKKDHFTLIELINGALCAHVQAFIGCDQERRHPAPVAVVADKVSDVY